MLPLVAAAQTRTVSGTVSDEDGTLVGVSIQLKGSTTGTVSDLDGKYSLLLPADGKAVLEFAYIGYATQEVSVENRSVIDVFMAEEDTSLDEVVVVGYGTQKKVTLSGAVVAIDAKEIATTKTLNVQNSLTGKMAGVKVVQGSSEPGVFSENSFAIRGMGSPLFVIDGVPRDNMVRLDPNEVETISVLKDASAAVYGTRAANGVVLITTKQGSKESKFKFDYTGYVGVEQFINEVQPLDAIGYMSMKNERSINNGAGILYPLSDFIPYMNGTKQSSDWVNTFVNPHPLETRHSLSATGGTKNITYFVNLGYSNQEGRWISNSASYEKLNLRSNVTADLGKGLKAKVLVNLMRDERREQPEASWRIFNTSWGFWPIDPIYLPDPVTGEASKDYPYNTPNTYHPGATTDQNVAGYTHYTQRLMQTNVQLDWEVPFVKGLKLMGMYSYDYRDDYYKKFRKGYVLYTREYKAMPQGTPKIEYSDAKWENTLMQVSVSYAKSLGQHNFDVMALYEESGNFADNFYTTKDVILGSIEHLYAGSANNVISNQDMNVMKNFTNKGIVGRLNYDYASKYIFTGMFRYDGSSKFHKDHRWGFFPSVSGAWRLSEENFVKDNSSLEFISNLKLRASYGVVGDDGAAAYQFLSGYIYPTPNTPMYSAGEGGGYIAGGKYINSVDPTTLPNRMITWYTAHTTDIGVDAEFWNGLLGVTADIFRRNRKGLLTRANTDMPNTVGAGLPEENIDSDRTEGVELTLTHRHHVKDFRYNVSGYIAMDRTKKLHIERQPSQSSYDNWKNNYTDRWIGDGSDGNGIYWGVDYLGRYRSFDEIQNAGIIYDGAGNIHLLPGDLIYDDYNQDGVIDDRDNHPIAIDHPAMSFGITFGGDWKGFDLNFTFQGTALNSKSPDGMFRGTISANGSGFQEFTDRWHRADPYSTDNGPSDGSAWVPGKYPSAYSDNNRDFITKNSQFWLIRSDYLRLKTLEIGYTVPLKITKTAGIEQLRVFANGYNLWTLSKMKLRDPEQAGNYPLNKSFNFGLNLTF
ncbi:SusC/RagA family TonB-linked outer membrane protein [Bacteroidia bacterium]|nr:SusC/RagA family TonB-linked outer membrane protein [Bacteroidia bacterium]